MQFLVRALFVLMLPMALAACPSGSNPDAVIHYTQVGACTQADFPNGRVTAQPSQAIVIFNVSFVDNTAVDQTWSFNPANLSVTPLSSQQSNLGSLGPVTIPAHQPVPLNSYVGILVATVKPDGSDAGQMNRFLHYEPPSNSPAPRITGVKGYSTQTLYPFVQDCDSVLWRNQKIHLTSRTMSLASSSAGKSDSGRSPPEISTVRGGAGS
jgi:hypothetical protein